MLHQLHHKCFGEVLPYLEINKKQDKNEIKENIEMPDVNEMSLNEAKKTLKELNLQVEVNGEESAESKVIDQLPKRGIQIQEGTKVTLYIN